MNGEPDVLLGISGGIAGYRAAELVRLLVREGVGVQVVMTAAAERFVGSTTFAGLSRRPVLTELGGAGDPVFPHLDAARAARVLCVAPCSANTLARLAHGIADSLLTESALAAAGQLVVAPAMNVRMWEHPATQANLAVLRDRGAIIVGPDDGELAEGERGTGRMAQPAAIAAVVEMLLRPTGPLAGLHVLVTAGGTREPLDAVRFLGNRSSGRMGIALADEALARGAIVTTLVCNSAVAPAGGTIIATPTANDLERRVGELAPTSDLVLMAAAVADYRPAATEPGKRRRADAFDLRLEPTVDILAGLGSARRTGQVLVGFAAEAGVDLASARAKRERKGVDLIVLNDVSRSDIGFDVLTNEVVLVDAEGHHLVPRADKRTIARAILDHVEKLLPR